MTVGIQLGLEVSLVVLLNLVYLLANDFTTSQKYSKILKLSLGTFYMKLLEYFRVLKYFLYSANIITLIHFIGLFFLERVFMTHHLGVLECHCFSFKEQNRSHIQHSSALRRTVK